MSQTDAPRGDEREIQEAGLQDLTPSLPSNDVRRFDLRTLGFVGYVSDEAIGEIERNACRASRVLTTAAKFAFR